MKMRRKLPRAGLTDIFSTDKKPGRKNAAGF